MNATPTTIGGVPVVLACNGRSDYRMQSLALPYTLPGKGNKRSHYAMCNWLWACAVPAPWPKPEDLADAIKEEEISAALDALFVAIEAAMPAKDEPDAKKNSGASAPSPALSSA